MDANAVLEMSNSNMGLAKNSYIISFVLLCILIALFITLIKMKKRMFNHVVKIIIPMVTVLYLLINSSAEAINANILSNQLRKDSVEMVSDSISGEIEGTYSKAKTSFIIIDSNSYVYDGYRLNSYVSIGERYDVRFLVNSKLIIEITPL